MKFIIFAFLVSFSLFAETIKYEGFDKAKSGTQRLKFIVESTKVGLFSSDVDGYVKSFSYNVEVDPKRGILRNMSIEFPVAQMDTDHEDRDYKLHHKCMGVESNPEIKIKVEGSLFAKSKRPQVLQGQVFIRGKWKPFSIEFKTEINKDNILVSGKSSWSLKEMEIPDPSIAVATLSDEIRIEVQFELPIKENTYALSR